MLIILVSIGDIGRRKRDIVIGFVICELMMKLSYVLSVISYKVIKEGLG